MSALLQAQIGEHERSIRDLTTQRDNLDRRIADHTAARDHLKKTLPKEPDAPKPGAAAVKS